MVSRIFDGMKTGVSEAMALLVIGLVLALLTYVIGLISLPEQSARAFAYLILILIVFAVLIRLLRIIDVR